MPYRLLNLERLLLLVLLLSLIPPAIANTDSTEIQVWSYYQSPPFVTAPNQGLLYDFVDLLNQQSKGRYQFNLTLYPRKRLDLKLQAGDQGIVLFVNGIWMSDPKLTRYLWSTALLEDHNEIISNKQHPVRYNGNLNSLKGLIFGGVLGREYAPLTEAITRGEIKREDSGSQEQNLKKLQFGRIDFTSMPETVFRYYEQQLKLEGQFYRADIPLTTYSRHLLITKGLSEVHRDLDVLIQDLEGLPQWQEILKRYGLSKMKPVKANCHPCS